MLARADNGVHKGIMQRSICLKPKTYQLKCYPRWPLCCLSRLFSSKTQTFHENDVVSGSHMVSSASCTLLEAFQLFNTGLKPSAYDLVCLTRACTATGQLSPGQQLHCQILKSGYYSNEFISTALIHFYVKLELVNVAHDVFDEIPEPNLGSWNSLMIGFVHSGHYKKALRAFIELQRSDLSPDSYSLSAVLPACGQLSSLQLGKSMHSEVVKIGVFNCTIVANCLIDMYGKCGAVEDSKRSFDEMFSRDIVSWNSIIAAHARNNRLEQALSLLHRMPTPDTISYNEVISGIAQFGNIDEAIEILYSMGSPNSSSWNSIITGYVNRSRTGEALEFFTQMHSRGFYKDQYTYSSILSGIANLSAIRWGCIIHSCTLKCNMETFVVVGTALVDMYSKCGKINDAWKVFVSLKEKNLITWNTIISGYAHNGDLVQVIQLFEQLVKVKTLQPDGITFLHVLSACWHNRMPLEGVNRYFDTMIKDYGIIPTAQHCSSMIKIMGQEGKLDRAEKMIKQLGFDSCGEVWRSLLGACVVCGDVEVAKVAAGKILQLEGDSEYVYVSMSNVYAHQGKWKDVKDIRAMMNKRNVKKEVGHSWIELCSMD